MQRHVTNPEQVEDALGTDEATAWAEYRSWADVQHAVWASTGVWAGEPRTGSA